MVEKGKGDDTDLLLGSVRKGKGKEIEMQGISSGRKTARNDNDTEYEGSGESYDDESGEENEEDMEEENVTQDEADIGETEGNMAANMPRPTAGGRAQAQFDQEEDEDMEMDEEERKRMLSMWAKIRAELLKKSQMNLENEYEEFEEQKEFQETSIELLNAKILERDIALKKASN